MEVYIWVHRHMYVYIRIYLFFTFFFSNRTILVGRLRDFPFQNRGLGSSSLNTVADEKERTSSLFVSFHV